MTESSPEGAFTLVVPAYNEEGAITETVETLLATLSSLSQFEILVVNDGSSDGTAAELERLDALHPQLRVITHDRNRGYGAALKTGISRARTPWVGITDADGTYPNERIPEMLGLAEKLDADMVVGARIIKDQVTYPLIRKIPKVFLVRWASWLSDYKIPDINSGMRVFKTESVKKFFWVLPDTFSFTTTISIAMLKSRHLVHYMPIGYKARIGNSKIKPIRDTLRFVQLITRTGMYFAPLRVLAPIFLILTLAMLVSLGFDVAHGNLTDKTVMLFIAAINVIMFALLADMIHRRSTA